MSIIRPFLLPLLVLLFLFFISHQAQAGDVVARSLLPRGTILATADIDIRSAPGEDIDSFRRLILGQQLRRTIYKGHKINENDLRAPILVRRNMEVQMIYKYGPLQITTAGRALGSGGKGDRIAVMNSNSRKKVDARIIGKNIVEVGQ